MPRYFLVNFPGIPKMKFTKYFFKTVLLRKFVPKSIHNFKHGDWLAVNLECFLFKFSSDLEYLPLGCIIFSAEYSTSTSKMECGIPNFTDPPLESDLKPSSWRYWLRYKIFDVFGRVIICLLHWLPPTCPVTNLDWFNSWQIEIKHFDKDFAEVFDNEGRQISN